ncbi:MAG: substrate-binding domain-containing protein [Polyangiaceae bacterium]|nr:substrate-binding domain-containing protein [Polyangiaceae bacterium]
MERRAPPEAPGDTDIAAAPPDPDAAANPGYPSLLPIVDPRPVSGQNCHVLIGISLVYPGTYADGVVRGMAHYAQSKLDWEFDLQTEGREGISKLLSRGASGLIVSGQPEVFESMLPTLKIPAVNIGHALSHNSISSVINDEEAIGEMAAEHLLLRGYRAFGYCTQTGGVLDGRLVGYQRGLKKRGVDCQVFDVRDALAHPERYPGRRLPTWLKNQPKPLGLFCMYDGHARELSRECAALGLRVPEDVAILGVDNDVNCLLGHPQLSSVQTSLQRIGYEAARLLDELIAGRGKNKEIRVPPVRVITRASTIEIVGSDKLVRAVLHHMQKHLTDSEGIERVCERFGVSRRQLERRFAAATGSTPAQAWADFRLEEAKRLLSQTTLSLERTAKECGYGDTKRLTANFKKATGMTPRMFRELMAI